MTDTPFQLFPSKQAIKPAAKSANIVQMDESIAAGSAGTFPACAALLEYWQDLSGTRQMPQRREFDPRGIQDCLSCTFVAEKVAPSVARIRVSGSVLNEALGMEVRGMPITALFDPCARDALAEATREVFENPAMSVLELSARRGFNRRPLRARMLLLPMSDSFGGVTRLVGCLDIQGGLGKIPRRFQINAMRRSTLTGDVPIASVEDDALPAPMPQKALNPSYAFAEKPTPFERKSKSEAPVGLRLVVNNAD